LVRAGFERDVSGRTFSDLFAKLCVGLLKSLSFCMGPAAVCGSGLSNDAAIR
jgi:hypothetical protein